VEAFWKAYLASLPEAKDALRRFYEVFRIGNTREGADEGAALIKQGVKTATSSLLWAYEAASKPLPEVGSLSIVTDGNGDPVCVVETIAVDIKGLAEVDAAFAHDYGLRCHALGKIPTPQMPLVCERFTVVYPSWETRMPYPASRPSREGSATKRDEHEGRGCSENT
jgi:uncharacterized protein YhfF